jgi:hypothetical protein
MIAVSAVYVTCDVRVENEATIQAVDNYLTQWHTFMSVTRE